MTLEEKLAVKIKTMFGAVAATAVIAALAAVPSATAATLTTNPASICTNYFGSDANFIEQQITTLYSSKASDTVVVCPLVRRTTDSNGAYAYVWLGHSSSDSTFCALYSLTVFGGVLASDSGTWTGSGLGYLILDVAGALNSNPYSTYVVYCTIPGSYNGRIYGLDLNEQ